MAEDLNDDQSLDGLGDGDTSQPPCMMTGDDILQKAMQTIDSKLIEMSIPQPPVEPAPMPVKPQVVKVKPPVSLTVDQFMAGLTKGNIRLASPTATTSDQKKLPITQLLQMAQHSKSMKPNCSSQPNVVANVQDSQPKTSNEPQICAKPKVRLASGETLGIGVEHTDLTEPPEGYMCVFMPIKQKSGDIKPILIPRGQRAPTLTVTAQIPDENELKTESTKTSCSQCCVYYERGTAHQHDCSSQKREVRKCARVGPEMDKTLIMEVEDGDDEDIDDVAKDEDFVLVEDDDDEDDDYKPELSKKKAKIEPELEPCPSPTKKEFKVEPKRCKVGHKITTKRISARTRTQEKKEVPKCSVCNRPYTSYDEHIACSGARSQSERNQKDGQMRSVEIQRVKRRRRVHRFLKLNFMLNPEIEEPPETEYVGSHLVKDEEDLLEEHFQGGDDRPPLGLICYVCSEPFPDDVTAYHHYTKSKCGPKYIGKVLFRSKNRAENRPNNVMVEKSEKGDRPKLGQRLKRNYYNAFKEKIVNEDGTDKMDHICTACGESFVNEEAVKEHYAREHRWRCKLCGDIYVHMKGVQLHYNRSHGKSYCVLCHVLFDSAAELQVHMRSHQKRLCDLCGQVLANKHHYNKHMLKQHNVANAEPLHHQIVKTKPQPRGLCEICGKEYSWPFLKTKHMASHFNPKPPKPAKKAKDEEEGELEEESRRAKSNLYPYRCDICSRGFQRVFYYNQHLERHAKGLACQRCGLYFAPQVDSQKHLAECMDNICADCGVRFATKEALKRHKQSHVAQEICKICNREFASKFLLKNHAQTHKQYQCKVCSKRFPSMEYVNKHKCFGKKFQCKICCEKFSSIKMSKLHAKTQHNREGMDVFTKKQVEFDAPDEESMMARLPPSTNNMTMPPIPGPSHVAPMPAGQPSMTAHEVSQALMTLHDFPMPGYSPMPLNMARDTRDCSPREPQHHQHPPFTTVKLQPAGFPPHPPHPSHPPPGYPGPYY